MNIPGSAVDALIVGAGISGAYAANRLLAANRTVTVLDARHRIGGRLLTPEGGGDLGGAWIWPQSEYTIKTALQEFNIRTVPMWYEGSVNVRVQNGQHHLIDDYAGNYAACGSGAVRVAGGASTFAEKLLEDNPKLNVELGKKVVKIEYDDDGAQVHFQDISSTGETTEKVYCRTVILAGPPKVLANSIEFVPPLPQGKMDSMKATPTWMEDYGKVAISFPSNWWRDLDMSAISIDQLGDVQTWWEACSGNDGDGSRPTLAGFVTAKGASSLGKFATDKPDELFDHILGAVMQVYAVDKKKLGLDEATCSNTETSGSPGEDGLIVSKGGITVSYKR